MDTIRNNQTRLFELAGSREPEFRVAVATSSLAWGDLLAQLSVDEDERVRVAVAKNPLTSSQTLEGMVEQVSVGGEAIDPLAKAMIHNPNASSDVLRALAALSDQTIAEEILLLRTVPRAVLEDLEKWPGGSIRRRAISRLITLRAEELGISQEVSFSVKLALFSDASYYNEGFDPNGYIR